MYQHCPKCKELIEETDFCPHCNVDLNAPLVTKRELSSKQKIMYALGYLILAFTAFFERDLTNRTDLIEGVVVFGAFVLFSALWFYIRGRGGLGRPPFWGF